MYFKRLHNIGREKFLQIHSLLTNGFLSNFHYLCYLKAFRTGVFLSFLPSITTGCSESVIPLQTSCRQTMLLTTPHTVQTAWNTLDILVFENDRLRRLDSYQRFEEFTEGFLAPASTGGDKIFFLCTNSQLDRYDWAGICSYSSLQKIFFDLEKEDREKPVMTGELRATAGEDVNTITMTPLTCEVKIERLSCDFSGTPYKNEVIRNVRAYLTNVNSSYPLLAVSSAGTHRLINAGMYNPSDAETFCDRSMVMQEMTSELGGTETKMTSPFLCYPNTGDRSRSTRLVIEGSIGKETYFWPIEVGEGNGVERNNCYTYEILIRRKGSSDPDCLIEPTAIDYRLKIKPWTEKEEYQVTF